MCLERVFSDDEMAEYLEGQPEVIEVWKAVEAKAQGYWTWDKFTLNYKYKEGFQKATQIRVICTDASQYYYSGYHAYPSPLNKRLLAVTKPSHPVPATKVKCLVKKEWITAIGKSDDSRCPIVIVASQAIFPHYPETEARYEDLPKEEITELAAAEKQRSEK